MPRGIRSLFVNKPSGVVAVEITSNAVRGIRMLGEESGAILDGFRIVRTRGGAKALPLDEAFAEVARLRRADEAIAIALSSPEIAIRRIELPPMSERELRQALPWEARRHIAGLADDALLDAQILNGGAATDGPMEVVLVAFPRAFYAEMRGLWSGIGIDPAFVDVSPMAAMNGVLRRAREPGPIALLDLGSGVGSFSIFSKSGLTLFRDLAMRAQQMSEALAPLLGVEVDDVDAWMASGKGARADAPPAPILQNALEEVIGELAEDLHSGLLYLENRTGTSLDRVHLSGSSAVFLERSGVASAVSAKSGIALERDQPFAGIRLGVVDEIALKSVSSELCTVAGLASRYLSL